MAGDSSVRVESLEPEHSLRVAPGTYLILANFQVVTIFNNFEATMECALMTPDDPEPRIHAYHYIRVVDDGVRLLPVGLHAVATIGEHETIDLNCYGSAGLILDDINIQYVTLTVSSRLRASRPSNG